MTGVDDDCRAATLERVEQFTQFVVRHHIDSGAVLEQGRVVGNEHFVQTVRFILIRIRDLVAVSAVVNTTRSPARVPSMSQVRKFSRIAAAVAWLSTSTQAFLPFANPSLSLDEGGKVSGIIHGTKQPQYGRVLVDADHEGAIRGAVD
ncbi:MAG: hypothetical protein R3E84_21385 [Pseudomonadales bacterium]